MFQIYYNFIFQLYLNEMEKILWKYGQRVKMRLISRDENERY